MKKKEVSPEAVVPVDAVKAIVQTVAGAKKVSHPGKFVKKNKPRLPRREKKALLRAAGNRPV